MKFRTVIIVGLVIRLLIAPFFAHPFDVYAWYLNGESLLTGKQALWSFLVPYSYSFFLFVFPSTALFNFLAKFITTYTLQMSSLNPILNPGPQWNILIVPGLLFDILVKLPLIISDTLIALVIHKLVLKHTRDVRVATSAAALWFLNPLTIWVSSGWGMFDTLPALFTLLALYYVLDKRFDIASISLVVAIALKYYAIILVIPLLIIAWKSGGIRTLLRTTLFIFVSSLLFFIPLMGESISGVVTLVTNPQLGGASGIHSSGLSIWTTVSLFIPSFHESLLSSLLLVVALIGSYVWVWKMSNADIHSMTHSFTLPILSLLVLYAFIAENYLVWILPFIAIIGSQENSVKKLGLAVSLVALISSITVSLLPFYMLPMTPWIGSYLVKAMSIISPYRVQTGGVIGVGLTLGKLYISIISLASFLFFLLLAIRLVSPSLLSKLKIRLQPKSS